MYICINCKNKQEESGFCKVCGDNLELIKEEVKEVKEVKEIKKPIKKSKSKSKSKK